MLEDYDAHRPNELFAERGTDWLTLEDAYAIQRAVAELRIARGERCLGYKVGCISATIQKQLGLRQPVRGYLWDKEVLTSGSHVICGPGCDGRENRFVNFAIEGEVAIELGGNFPAASGVGGRLTDGVARWFPVIELHNAVFRGPAPTSQELVAGNAMHAGFVIPSFAETISLQTLLQAQIRVKIDGKLVETSSVADLPGGPLGSLRGLASFPPPGRESFEAGDIILTGSPGSLIPIEGSCTVTVECEGQRVDLFVHSSRPDEGF